MIGVIDPAFFLPRPDRELDSCFAWLVRICRDERIQIPTLGYWDDLWRELGEPLEARVGPNTRRALQAVRKLGDPIQSFNNLRGGKAWRKGFSAMFGTPLFQAIWEDRMARAFVEAFSQGEDVILLTRQVANRNVTEHTVGQSVLREITRWLLYIQSNGAVRRVRCVYHARNLSAYWSIRFDWRLPDSGVYPFCPPDNWWKGTVSAVGTRQSEKVFLDRWGNGWARPNIPEGAGHHWDLFVSGGASGGTHINVVAYGAPASEGQPGNVHHVPTGQAAVRFRLPDGWRCPPIEQCPA